MQEKHLYEYAVIRLVPRVEREEFINIGLILFSKQARYLKVKNHIDTKKIYCLFNWAEEELDYVYSVLEAFSQISLGNKKAGAIAEMDIPNRFRWLTSMRSTIIQTSRPHPGFSTNLDITFNTLFDELIL